MAELHHHPLIVTNVGCFAVRHAIFRIGPAAVWIRVGTLVSAPLALPPQHSA